MNDGPTRGDTQSDWVAPKIGRVAAPLREQAKAALRQAILDQEFRPGQRLVERELVEKMQVSRTTVREVIRELAAEGLVYVAPQRGAMVAVLSEEEVVDIYEAREAIESVVVKRFVQRASPHQVRRLTESVGEFAQVAKTGWPIRDMLAAKDRFYDLLLEGAGGTTLKELLERLQARVAMLRAASLSEPGRPERAADELLELARAIEAKDTERAVELCAGHVRSAAEAGINSVARSNGG